MSGPTTSSETLDSMATRLEEWATDRDSMTPKEMYGANERSVLLRTVAKRLRALSDSPVRPTGDAQGWLDLLATCVSCKKRIADPMDELVRCFDCRASYCRSHFPIHFRDEVREMREEIERLHAERSVVTPPDAVRAAIESLQRWDTIPYHEGIGRYAYGAFVRYEDVLAALASRGDVAGYSEVLAMANDAVEKRGIKDVAALHYIDGYLAAAGEFSGKPGLYEGSYPPGSGETSVQAVRETTWPIYDTPCIPSCRAAGPVTHTRGCHNNGKISPVEAASGNYDREPSSLSSGTVSE